MIVSQLVAASLLRATGKVSTSVSGDAKWTKVLAIANLKISDWQNEPGVDWMSLYNPAFSIGTVTATDTFAIPTTVRKISDTDQDYVRILHTDGKSYTDYELVSADTLKQYYNGQTKQSPNGYYCAQIGSNLVFNHTFLTTDKQFGGSITVPIFTFAPTLVADSDVVPVDNPGWLVVACAAEYVRNDVTKLNQYPNLINEANALMERMKDDNDAQVVRANTPFSAAGATW